MPFCHHGRMAECSDLDRQIQMLRRREIISEEQVSALCVKARELLIQEGNVQPIDSPVTVCFGIDAAAAEGVGCASIARLLVFF